MIQEFVLEYIPSKSKILNEMNEVELFEISLHGKLQIDTVKIILKTEPDFKRIINLIKI